MGLVATKAALWRVLAVCAALPVLADSVVLDAMRSELARSMDVLGQQDVAPYFLSYEITEQDNLAVSAEFGALMHSDRRRSRYLDVDLRVGDYQLDNTRELRGERSYLSSYRRSVDRVPLEDDADAIRATLWNATDARYKRAVEQLAKVKSDVELKVDAEDQSDDFSREEPEQALEAPAELRVAVAPWRDKVRRYSAPFAAVDVIFDAAATFSATAETRWFVNSEGARIRTAQTRYRLSITAHTKAEDGMVLPRYESFAAFSLEGLPGDEQVLAAVTEMVDDLLALRRAPVVDPYSGPAILSGRASGVFFHEILGHRVEGHRQKSTEDGQTFKKKINERILPDGFTVTFDPTRRSFGAADLAGAYRFDNEGVPARPITIVEDGILRGFLMSRTPIEGFPASNGHGRKQIGYRPVARQSNLIVEAAEPVSQQGLKERLLTMLEEQGKPFGLLFDDVAGGFALTGRIAPNAFNVQPIMVYRIYPDGRQELVRGVDLIGTPLTTLSRVTAADDEVGVFNGICGAESGGVAVAAVSPGVLISQIEVQKTQKSQQRTPLLPPPAAVPSGNERQ